MPKIHTEFDIPDEIFGQCVENAIKKNPDYVLVVRCKDCKYYKNREGYCWNDQWITHDDETWVNEDDFCSYGERKDDNQ